MPTPSPSTPWENTWSGISSMGSTLPDRGAFSTSAGAPCCAPEGAGLASAETEPRVGEAEPASCPRSAADSLRLPASVVSALSVGLYGMFLAIIIPPARKSRILAVLIVISMAASYLFSKLALTASISPGIRTIILTVVIAGIAAILFPVREEEGHHAA